MAQPTRPDEVGMVPRWVIALVGIAWVAITIGIAAYVAGIDILSL